MEWITTYAISTLLGFFTGLGIGGGSLLLLWLTLVMGLSQDMARCINLLYFLPCALIACLFRWNQGHLDFKKVLPGILGGMASAALFSFLSGYIDADFLRKPFGFLLLATGIRELLYRRRNDK